MNPIEILLIEDDEEDIVLILEAFAESLIGCKISLARNGEAALDYLYKRKDFAEAATPTAIVMDFNLPLVNGGEILKIIKSDVSLSSIPVAILTSLKIPGELLYVQPELFLTKPNNCCEYLGLIRSIENLWVAHSKAS